MREKRQFRIAEGVDVQEISELPFLVQLMQAFDAVRSATRRLQHSRDWGTTADKSDWIQALISGFGWCGESFRLLTKGATDGLVKGEMFSSDPEASILWKEIQAEPKSERVKKAHRIRDKFFAHADEEIATTFIQSQQNEALVVPFCESDSEGAFLDTSYPWGQGAFLYELVGDDIENFLRHDVSAFKDFARDLGILWGKTSILLGLVLQWHLEQLKQKGRIRFELMED